VTVSLRRSRLLCPCCDYLTSAVYDTRPGLTRDFEDLVAYFATKTDKTAITRILRIAWDTVRRACERVVADGLVNISVDEVSWRGRHRYLLVTDHVAGKIVWGAGGKDTATLDVFFDDLGSEKAAALQAIICINSFHAVKLTCDALAVLRRQMVPDEET